MSKFKYVDLFSGLGGFRTALDRLGGECVLASEIDKYANRAYKLLYGHETAGDVTQIDASLVPDHDILVGGFPCQAFSVAGKRGGFNDARGTLFFEAARIASVKQPSFVFMENVKGLISHDKGKTLETMLFVLNDIGYAVDFAVLNSKHFGVPQNRERIFIIGKRTDQHVPWDIPPGNDVVNKAKRKLADMGLRTFNFTYPTNNSATTRLLDILEDNVDEKYYISDEKAKGLIEHLRHSSPNTYEPQEFSFEGDGISYTIDANYWKGTSIGNIGKGRRTHILESHPPCLRIRKLTSLECFRLQGFPDAYYHTLKSDGISDTQLYKMAGNAVSVPIIEAIGRELVHMLVDNTYPLFRSEDVTPDQPFM